MIVFCNKSTGKWFFCVILADYKEFGLNSASFSCKIIAFKHGKISTTVYCKIRIKYVILNERDLEYYLFIV